MRNPSMQHHSPLPWVQFFEAETYFEADDNPLIRLAYVFCA
jgi:hypothetical protein